MVRSEFYTFSKITKKLNAFQGKILEALTYPAESNKHLRNRTLVEVTVREVNAHNAWIAQLEGAPKGDVSLQTRWEAERLCWWRKHARYQEHDSTIPKFKIMIKSFPEIRVDDFHAGGRIARDAGFHINDLAPADRYIKNTVACFWDSPESFTPQDLMLH